MRIKFALVCLAGLFLSNLSFAQNGAYVSVNNYTGSPGVTIPLYSFTSGTLSLPITAVYQGDGVKVKDIKGPLGMNWQVSAGGQISRAIRGLPDDIKSDNLSNTRLGWLYNTNGTKINNFTIANDNSNAVCTDETADNNYISSNFNDLSDTEPDVFNISAPGLNCQFVFDNNHVIRTIPYQDIKISYISDGTTGKITSFTVVNDQGVTYTFSQQEQETRKSSSSGTVSYFKRKYDQYVNGITFSRSWKLTGMFDLSFNSINFNYTAGVIKSYTKLVSVVLPGASASTIQYNINTNVTPQLLSTIQADDDPAKVMSFSWLSNTLSSIKGMGVKILFSMGLSGSSPSGTDRAFLRTLSMEGSGEKKLFNFDYNGVIWDNGTTPGSVALPDSSSKKIDYWGYYNNSSATSLIPQVLINSSNSSIERYRNMAYTGSSANYPYTLSGTSRDASLSGAANGTLMRVTYEDGSWTSIDYELNDFYDNTAGSVMQGGGVRAKILTQYDGYNTANNIITNYTYINPATGLSSGKPITMPVYAFTTPYTGTGTDAVKWTSSTVRSEEDLNEENESIVYSHVKVSQPGIGSTISEYSVPGTYWDGSASPDWTPTTVYSGRTACAAATFATNQANNYPYVPNTNFDFERGLLLKLSAYNETGQQVSENAYTYIRSFASPAVTTGFKFDNNTSSVRNYAKYKIYTGTSKLIQTQTSKIFDQPGSSTFSSSSVTYNYTSSAHKLPTRTDVTNSDGTTVKSYVKYVKDYTTSLGSDSMANSLYRLKLLNLNLPIERYEQLQQGTVLTTKADLTLFKRYSNVITQAADLPAQSLQFVSPDGVTDFQPSAIVSNTFTKDSRYRIKSNSLVYDQIGQLQSADDNNGHIATTISDPTTGQPYITVNNALAKEIIYDQFNTYYPETGFSYTDTIKTRNDRAGQWAVTIKPTSSIFKNAVVKNAKALQYVFSVWVNTAATGNLVLKLTNTSINSSYNYTLTIPNTAGKWQYLEMKVPVGNMSPTFNVQLTPSSNTLIDDVLFYPGYSNVSTYVYDPLTTQTLAQTNTNGVSVYYGYDNFGRPRFVYDQDKNIVQKKSYLSASSYNAFSADFSFSGSGNYNNPMNFSNPHQSELEGSTWTWNFGDGTPVVIKKSIDTIGRAGNLYGNITHTYTAAGTYNVTLTKLSPLAGTKTVTKSVIITDHSTDLVPVETYAVAGATINAVNFSGTGAGSPSAGQVYQGVYSVTVNTSGPFYNPTAHNGFKSVYLMAGNTIVACSDYHSGSNNYIFPGIDLNGATRLAVFLSTDTCSAIVPPVE